MAEADTENSGAAESGDDGKFLVYEGPLPSVKYPVNVLYCPGE